MKRFSNEVSFTSDSALGPLSTFRQSDTGEWVRAVDALKVERELAEFQRASVFTRMWAWLVGYRVKFTE